VYLLFPVCCFAKYANAETGGRVDKLAVRESCNKSVGWWFSSAGGKGGQSCCQRGWCGGRGSGIFRGDRMLSFPNLSLSHEIVESSNFVFPQLIVKTTVAHRGRSDLAARRGRRRRMPRVRDEGTFFSQRVSFD